MQPIKAAVRAFLEARRWDKLAPGDISKSIAIEAAELLELFQWTSPSASEISKDKIFRSKIESELADVMIYCFEMSIILDIDLEDAILRKLSYINRKYPPELVSIRPGGRPDNEEYHRIKTAHRDGDSE